MKTCIGTYTVNYICSNCGRHSAIQFEKGTKAPSVTECPVCGVQAANKLV